MMKLRPLAAATLLCLFSVLASCGPTASTIKFKDTVRSFTQQIRWGRLEGAALFLPPAQRTKWLTARRAQTQAIKITDMQILGVRRGGARGNEAIVDMRIAWYLKDTMTVQQADWRLVWKIVEGSWQLDKESRLSDSPVSKPTAAGDFNWP